MYRIMPVIVLHFIISTKPLNDLIFLKEPDGGSMKGLAFAYDPDGYAIEIIKRGGIEFGDKRVD